MLNIKRIAASIALSLALVATAAPSLQAAILHCTGCSYVGSGSDQYGSYDVYECDECHIDG